MLVELRDVEVYVEPDDILSKALREGDLSISEAVCICEDEAGAEEVLKSIDDTTRSVLISVTVLTL